jgi:NADH dehydrogenase [ubiquinone] 1 alpha subcomplex assembly factor 5
MVNTSNDIVIFDRARLRHNRRRAAAHAHNADFLVEWAERHTSDRLQDVKRKFPLALQIGGRNSLSTPQIGHLLRMDTQGKADIIAEEELFPFAPQSFDLITSTLQLHAVNDLPGALVQIKQSLKPDGLLLTSMFGGETLFELRESLMHAEIETHGGASPRVFPFADKPQAGALLQRAGFALPVIDSEIITVTYDNMFKLLHDLRFMGEGNIIKARQKKNPGRTFFVKAAEYYAKNFAEPDGRIRASFEIIFLIGWAPHASQQQPLRPGSAQNRLADALEATEIKAGGRACP